MSKKVEVNGYSYSVDGNELISHSKHERWGRYRWEVQVSDLTDMKVWEYNELVDKIKKHHPNFKIEKLEGRYV